MSQNKTKLATENSWVSQGEFLALIYHSLFDYPLTRRELSFWQVGAQARPRYEVEKTGIFFHLPGQARSVLKRLAAASFSKKKIKIAVRAARLLRLLPSIKLVGLSGALSMTAAQKDDDIDLLIVTAKDCLWTTRLFTFFLLKLAGFPVRRAGDRQFADKLCLNLWLDEANLSFGPSGDVYIAHEIVQVKPIVDRGGWAKLLRENNWVWQVFPGARPPKGRLSKPGRVTAFLFRLASLPFKLFNWPAYRLQLTYMAKRRTRETVQIGRALFHPVNWREVVDSAFAARIRGTFSGAQFRLWAS